MRWTDRIGKRLKLRDLHTLRVVVDTGSMAQAAKQLALSQPAISKSIAEIEHTLGVSLLDRTPRGVVPTPYADVLLKRGMVIFDDLRLALEEIEHLRDPTQGELQVGAPEPLIPLLTVIIDGLVSRHPRMHFDVTVADTSLLLAKLRGRELDIAFTRLPHPVAEPDLETEVLYDDPLVVMAGQASPWLKRRRIGLADLVHERWALSPPETLLGRFAAEVFQSRGLTLPRAVVVTPSVQMRVSLVTTGRYLSILPRAMLRAQRNASLRALRIDLSETKRPVGLVLLNKRTIGPIASVFIAAARQVISTSRAASTSTERERRIVKPRKKAGM
jgi:DNA-binding transcriptional LysR family regulator